MHPSLDTNSITNIGVYVCVTDMYPVYLLVLFVFVCWLVYKTMTTLFVWLQYTELFYIIVIKTLSLIAKTR